MTPKEQRARRRRFWLSLPFVFYVDERRQCDGVCWSRVPVRAVWHPKTHRRQPLSMLDPYRCRTPAHWRFKALKKSRSKSGTYCMSHLVTQCIYDPHEEARVQRYWERFTKEHADA